MAGYVLPAYLGYYRPVDISTGEKATERYVIFLWRKLPMSLNDRYRNWGHKARVTADVRREAGWRVKAEGIRPAKRIRVQLAWRPATRRTRDASNAIATQKPVLDAVVDAGVVPDDSGEFVEELMPRLLPPEGRDRAGVWLVVEVVER